MTYAWTAAAALTGVAAGPWLRARILANAVPYGRRLRTGCPACRHRLPSPWWRAWLPVTGRCPACRRRIGPATGIVEAVLGAALAVLAWSSSDAVVFAATAWLAGYAVVLAFVDVTVHRLPDRLMWQAFTGCGALLTVDAVLTGHPARLVAVAVGVLVPGLVYFIPVLARPDQLGLGDAKLAATTGLALGWLSYTAVLTGLAAGVVLGVAAALTLHALRRITARQSIAHGPAILLGALLTYSLLAPTH